VTLSILATCIYRDSFGWATFDVLFLVFLMSMTGHIPILDIWAQLQVNPLLALWWVGGYLLLGITWATAKWVRILVKIRNAYREWRKNNPDMEPDSLAKELNLPYELLRKHLKLVEGKPKVDVSDYKTRIMGWIAYWPISALLWILGDLLADTFEMIYQSIRGLYQGMADRILNG
jgi:hypothetical protein